MPRRILSTALWLAASAALAASLSGCRSAQPDTTTPDTPATTTSTAPDDSGAAGMQLAPGIYEQQDGTALAIGVLEWSDVEGGFWALIDTREGADSEGSVVAVIANASEDDSAYTALAGQQVVVSGRKLEGASIRQAGPEIEASKVEPYGAGGPAD